MWDYVTYVGLHPVWNVLPIYAAPRLERLPKDSYFPWVGGHGVWIELGWYGQVHLYDAPHGVEQIWGWEEKRVWTQAGGLHLYPCPKLHKCWHKC